MRQLSTKMAALLQGKEEYWNITVGHFWALRTEYGVVSTFTSFFSKIKTLSRIKCSVDLWFYSGYDFLFLRKSIFGFSRHALTLFKSFWLLSFLSLRDIFSFKFKQTPKQPTPLSNQPTSTLSCIFNLSSC